MSPEEAKQIATEVCEREESKQPMLMAAPSTIARLWICQGIIVFPKAAHRAEFLDLAKWKSRIVEFCEQHKIKVLILDNLSTLNETLEDENDATACNPLNALVVALK